VTELSSAPAGSVDPTAASPWREPVRGGYPDPALFGLTGRDQLQAMLAGHAPQPPMSRLTGLRLCAVGKGTAAFQMPLSQWLASSNGTVSIGPIAIPADAAVACAIQTALPAATPFSTSELSLRLLSPTRPGGTLTATGKLIALRQTIGLAEVTVTDQHGALMAHGSSICFLQSPLSPAPEPPTLPAGPHQKDAEEQDRSPPASRRRPGARRGRVADPGWAGGAAETAGRLAGAGADTPPHLLAGTSLAPVDLKVNYLRPLRADGRIAYASGQVVHLGRRTAVATAEVHDGDGRPVALATGSALVLAGGPAALGHAAP